MTTTHEISWDDSSVAGPSNNQNNRKVERFVGKQGLTTRIAIITEKPIRTFTHYKRGYGYFSCNKVDGLECVACASGDRVSEKFATNILVYPLTAAPGQAPLDPTALKVMLWQPGPKVFADLRAIREEWGDLRSYDVKITCTNEQYQHLNITNCRESLWASDPNATILGKFLQENEYDLKKLVGGKKESVDEVRQIWTSNVTRETLKAEREKNRPSEPAPVMAGVGAGPAGPPPAVPNFADLLKPRTA